MLNRNSHKHKELEFIEKEKHNFGGLLGIIFDNNMKFSSHAISQKNETIRFMRLIRRSYTYLSKSSFR